MGRCLFLFFSGSFTCIAHRAIVPTGVVNVPPSHLPAPVPIEPIIYPRHQVCVDVSDPVCPVI